MSKPAEPEKMPQSLRDYFARQAAIRTARHKQQCRQDSEARLYAARTAVGRVDLRFPPYVRTKRHAGSQYLRGQGLRVSVPEVIDAWELLGDMYRFLKGWRPMRLRTEPQRVATKAVFEQWERLGAAVEPGRWG